MSRTPRRRPPGCRAVLAILAASVAGCGLPLDPKGTGDRVRGGTLRVGAVHHPPWIVAGEGGPPTGIEAELVDDLAGDLGARVAWTVGGETALMLDLERHRLDLVVGGLARKTAWRSKVALSRPHARGRHGEVVLACPPGENGWLLRVDRWLDGRDGPGEGGP